MLKRFPFHPLLFAVFPALSLYTHNIHEVHPRVLFVPITASLLLTLLVLTILRATYKDITKAGIITSLFVISFFSFGHSYIFAQKISQTLHFPIHLERYRYLLLLHLIILAACSYLIVKTKVDLKKFAGIFNLVAFALIFISMFQIFHFHLRKKPNLQKLPKVISQKGNASQKPLGKPDIYYLILDGHASNAVLKGFFDHDHSSFSKYLRKNGFFFSENSKSNYPHSHLSMASSLNMSHLLHLPAIVGESSKNVHILNKMIQENQVSELLKERGYRFINLASGWDTTNHIEAADINVGYISLISKFSWIIIRNSMLKIFEAEIFNRWASIHRHKRQRILFTFRELAKMSKTESPKFVFAHIFSPHAPFVFNADGSLNQNTSYDSSVWDDKKAYVNEVIFISKKIKELTDKLLSESKTPPVIILQGDHGPCSSCPVGREQPEKAWDNISNDTLKERTGILNAYHLKKKCREMLYDTITPVNTFRSVFNCYFGTDYKMLKDNVYWSTLFKPYKFREISDIVVEK